MNFYKKLRNQRLHNRTALISYTEDYVCFINTLKSSNSNINNCYKRYLSLDWVNKKAINLLTNENLAFDNIAISYCSITIHYTILKVLSHYFSQAMQKNKVIYKNDKTSYACNQIAIAS